MRKIFKKKFIFIILSLFVIEMILSDYIYALSYENDGISLDIIESEEYKKYEELSEEERENVL